MKYQDDDIISSTFAELAFFLVFVFAFAAVAFSEESGIHGDRVAFLKTKGKMSCYYEALGGLASVPQIDPEGLPLFSGTTPPRLAERGVIAVKWDKATDRFTLRDNLFSHPAGSPVPLNSQVPSAHTTLRAVLVRLGTLHPDPGIASSVDTDRLHDHLVQAVAAANRGGADCAMYVRWIDRNLVEQQMLGGNAKARNAHYQMLRIDKIMPGA